MGGNPMWKNLNGTDVDAGFARFAIDQNDVANSGAVINFKAKGAPIPESVQIITLDVSIKPFMNLVWVGTFAIVIGFFFSAFRFRQKLKKEDRKNKSNGVAAHSTNGNDTASTNGNSEDINKDTDEEISIKESK